MSTHWVNWRKAIPPKLILLEDLESGVLPLDESELSAEDAWNSIYSKMKEFELVPFDQFAARLKDHRSQVSKRAKKSQLLEAAWLEDCKRHKPPTCYPDGRPMFYLSPAFLLLRADIEAGLHKQMKLENLRQSRPEYKSPWSRTEFKFRVYQEIRYRKFVNYLEFKRKEILDTKVTLVQRQKKPQNKGKEQEKKLAVHKQKKPRIESHHPGLAKT